MDIREAMIILQINCGGADDKFYNGGTVYGPVSGMVNALELVSFRTVEPDPPIVRLSPVNPLITFP